MTTNLTISDINDGIAKGVINEAVLSKTLEQLRNYAYSYLYNLQKDMVNVYKAQYKYNDFALLSDDVFTGNPFNYYNHLNIKKAFIHHNMRLKFRRSKYYNTPVTNEQIDDNRDIFIYNYLVFINGYLDTSAKIRCKEEVSSVCLRAEEMGDLGAQFITGAKVDVLFLQDSKIVNVTMSRADLVKSDYKFTLTGITLKDNDKVFAFVYKDKGLKRCYNVTTDNTGHFVLPADSCNYYNDGDTLGIKLLFVANHSEEIDCPVGTDFIQHKAVSMPMPGDNMLIFRKGEKSELFLDSSVSITEKYPDVFQLPTKHTDAYEIHTLYWENSSNAEMKYDSDLSAYAKVINILDKYSKNEMPTVISEFKPYSYKYDLVDYCGEKLSGNLSQYAPLVYKVNKFNTLFKLWGFSSQLYYENLKSKNEGYILPMKSLDLSTKIRKDNHTEISDPDNQATFTEDRYVYVFKNEDSDAKLPYKFWIDGVRYVPDQVYLDGTYEYVYIPVSKITKTSTIEIERSSNNAFKTKVVITTGSSPLKFVSNDDACPFTSLFLVDADGNYIDSAKYKITAMIGGEERTLTTDSTMIVSNALNMKIYPMAMDAQNTTIYAVCNDIPLEFTKSITFDNYMERNLNKEGLIHNIKLDPTRIRIFKHGLLVPTEKYLITFPKNYNDNVKIDLNFDRYFNDLDVDYLPEGYDEVYHADDVDVNGVVNLEGYINKPFSNKYYDVYVNGVKLLPSQIDKLSNFTIAIKNVTSLRKLYVYEKHTAKEVFQFDGESSLLSDQLLRTDETYKKSLLDYIEDIKTDPSVPDVDTMFDVIENFFIGLIEDYFETSYVNAEDTITGDVVSNYYGFFKDSVFFIDGNSRYENRDDAGIVYFLSPQEYPEIAHINNPYYVKEFNTLADSFVGKYLDASVARDDITKTYPTINRVDKDNAVTFFDGNSTTRRNGTGSKLMGVE